jgi:predicted nucleotidyltransferase
VTAANRQLDDLLALVREVLSDDLVGAYVHGSAVLGGMLPTSDLDLLVVSRRELAPDERRHLVTHLLVLSAPPDSEGHGRSETRPIELSIVTESAVRPWRFPPEMEFQYGDWMRDDYVAGVLPERVPNPDLAIVVELARRGNEAVAGPPPGRIFEPVPWQHIVASMLHGLDGLMADLESDTRNVILTLARIWMTLATGDIKRKDEAASWSAQRLPADLAAVLERARQMYLNGEYGPWGDLEPSVAPAADRLLAEIRTPVARRRRPARPQYRS